MNEKGKINDEIKPMGFQGEFFIEEAQEFYNYFIDNVELPNDVNVQIWSIALSGQFYGSRKPGVVITCELKCEIEFFMNRMVFTYENGNPDLYEKIVDDFEVQLGKKCDEMKDKIHRLKAELHKELLKKNIY